MRRVKFALFKVLGVAGLCILSLPGIVKAQEYVGSSVGKVNLSIADLPGVSPNTVLLEPKGSNNQVANFQTLSVGKVKIANGQTIWGIAQDSGFQPNGDLMNVVRALNPDKDSIDSLKVGEDWVIPTTGNQADSPKSQFILFDKGWRESLGLKTDLAYAINPKYANKMGESYRQGIGELGDSLVVVESNKSNIPGDVLSQILRDADIAKFISQQEGGHKNVFYQTKTGLSSELEVKVQGLNAAERESLFSAAIRSVKSAATSSSAGRTNHRTVSVNTFSEEMGDRRCRLSVYSVTEVEYILKEYFRKKRLRDLSTPASGPVSIAERRFWAEWKGEVVSGFHFENLLSGTGDIQFDLLVQDGGRC